MDRDDVGLLSRCPSVPRRLLTVDEYHRMGEAGMLTIEALQTGLCDIRHAAVCGA